MLHSLAYIYKGRCRIYSIAKKKKRRKFGQCSNSNPVGSDGITFQGRHNCSSYITPNSHDELDLPVLVLGHRRKVLIPLLSPWEEDDNVFDSLFWLTTKSLYQYCSWCLPRRNTYDCYKLFGFQLLTARTFMYRIIGRGVHDITGINGRITPWDSAGRMVSQSNKSRSPRGGLIGSPGPSCWEIFESFNWEKAIHSEYRRLSMMSKNRYKCDNTDTENRLFRKPLPYDE